MMLSKSVQSVIRKLADTSELLHQMLLRDSSGKNRTLRCHVKCKAIVL